MQRLWTFRGGYVVQISTNQVILANQTLNVEPWTKNDVFLLIEVQ